MFVGSYWFNDAEHVFFNIKDSKIAPKKFYIGQSSNGVVDPSLLTQSVKVAPSIVPVIPAVSGSMLVRESGRGA